MSSLRDLEVSFKNKEAGDLKVVSSYPCSLEVSLTDSFGPEEHYIVATGPKILLQVQVSK